MQGVQKLVSRKIRYVRNLHAEPKRRRCFSDDKKGRQEQTHGLCLHKSKGQHLLTNQRVLDSIVRNSDIKPTDTVLEIGPGTGNLTLKLLEAAEKVVAVEIDPRMVEILRERVSERGLEDRLSIIRKDVLKTELPQFDVVVANIAYNISSPLVCKLVYGPSHFRSATLLLQKEFAARMLAKPGESGFNRLAANLSLVAEVEHVACVPRKDFVPCPKVDSSVVTIRPRASLPDIDLGEWLAFTRACFGTKNKTLGATFKAKRKVFELLGLSEPDAPDSQANIFREKIVGVLRSGGFEDKRPWKMSNEELMALLVLFNQAGIYFRHRSLNAKDIDYDEELVCGS